MKTTYRRTIASVLVVLSLGASLLGTVTAAHASARADASHTIRGR